MLQEIIQTLRERGLLKWVIGTLVLLVVILVVSIVLQPRYTRHTLQTAPFTVTGGDFSHLSGTDLYAYNGAAFYKASVTNPGEMSVLSEGVKMPVPREIIWAGDQGVLVNFRESFSLTLVDEFLQRNGDELNETAMNHTWYFDFESESLRKVHEKPLVSSMGMYSAEENGFYYIPDLFFTPISEAGDDVPDSIPLNFYDIAEGRSREVVRDLELLDITHISTCHDDTYRVCLVGRDEEDIMKLRLYGIGSDGQREVLLESDARLIPSNDPSLYVTTTDVSEEQPVRENEDGDDHEHIEPDIDFSPSPAVLHNLRDKTSHELGFDIAGEEVIPYFTSFEDFYFLNSESASLGGGEGVYRSGTTSVFGNLATKEFPLQLDGSTTYDGSFSSTVDYGDGGVVFVASADGEKFLFAPNDTLSDQPLERVAETEVEATVRNCAEQHGEDYQYFAEEGTFRVFFENNSRFKRNIEAFAGCFTTNQHPRALIGTSFYFGAVDPVNGRIVTD
jgi:hypothetical protein